MRNRKKKRRGDLEQVDMDMVGPRLGWKGIFVVFVEQENRP